MKIFSSILLGSAAGLALVSGAQSADLPTKKAPAPPSTVSCFASFYDYMSASAKDCPLTYMGVTVYGQIDVGAGWNSHASRFNPTYNNGVLSVVSKTSQGPSVSMGAQRPQPVQRRHQGQGGIRARMVVRLRREFRF